MHHSNWLIGIALLTSGLALAGCRGDSDPTAADGDFVSDNPMADTGAHGGDTGAASTAGGDEGDPSDEGAGGDDDGEREISEADIVHIDNGRLYALSRYSGLAVIDVSNPDQLPVLGRTRAHAEPFEMYVDNAQVFAMFSDYGNYRYDDETGAWIWASTSKLMAFDARDPADIQVTGEFDLPGTIQDSRRVGDVLYVVTYEDGYCWGCSVTPNTTITSLDVSDPARVEVVDQVVFEQGTEQEYFGGGARSVSATDERMYVAGVDYGEAEVEGSTIDVIDISDPGGQMLRGVSFKVAGAIESRWQMNEYDGALRVVSQLPDWQSDAAP